MKGQREIVVLLTKAADAAVNQRMGARSVLVELQDVENIHRLLVYK